MPTATESRRERTRQRAAALQARAQRIAERAQTERTHHTSLDAAFEMVDRDAEVGGGIIAGALAYRCFFWSLPAALVVVAGLGLASDAASTSPEKAGKTLGLAGLISSSVASASNSAARWYALLVGVPLLLLATRSLLRVLIGCHRLVWGELRERTPKPTASATLQLLTLVIATFAVTAAASAARAAWPTRGFLVSVIILAPYAACWLLVSLRLPHGAAGWRALVPGALLFGVGLELIQLVTAYFIAPYSLEKQGTYGALGFAAALLLGLFLIARVIVASAVMNATLWERHLRSQEARSHAPAPETSLAP